MGTKDPYPLGFTLDEGGNIQAPPPLSAAEAFDPKRPLPESALAALDFINRATAPPTEEDVERAARALNDDWAVRGTYCGRWDDLDDSEKDRWREAVYVVIGALEDGSR